MNDAGPGPGQGLVTGHWDPSVLRPSVHTGRSELSAGLMVKYLRGNVICDQRCASTALHYGALGSNFFAVAHLVRK